MKTIAKMALVIGFVSNALAQGTIEFRAKLQPVPGFEWYYDSYGGQFFLNGNVLNGTAIYVAPSFSTFTRIENATATTLFAPSDISLAPENASLATWTDVRLTDTQVDELVQGEWSLNIGTVDFPDGALRGQIIVVPEPSTFALFACGIVVLAAFRTRRAKETSHSL